MSTRLPVPDLGILIASAWQEFVRAMHVDLAGHGFDDLGRSDGYVFRTLAAGPMTVSALATKLEVTKQGAGQIIDDMEARGYVVRRPDLSDGRARLVELSARGRAAMAAARRFHQSQERALIRAHSPAAVTALRTVLSSLAADIVDGQDPQLRAMSL